MFCYRCGNQLQQDNLYCSQCGTLKIHVVNTDDLCTEKEIIDYYFTKGLRYVSILLFIKLYHNIDISLRTLKRRLSDYGLRKRNEETSGDQVKQIITNEVQGPSSLRGYRSMWNKLRTTYRITVPRETVMKILRDIDPEKSAQRKARKLLRRTYDSLGPNATWHVDGYDKLKPYGLPIHGCIDGFSRKIL